MSTPKTFGLMMFAAFAPLAAGCGLVRTPAQYHEATQKVLATKSADIKACYDGVIQPASAAAGKVTVTFTVMPDTGKLTGARVTENTTNVDGVGECITKAIDGLTIDPPDSFEGRATYSFDFEVAPRMQRTREGGLVPAPAEPAEPKS